MNKPLFAMPQPMQFDDPLVHKHCMQEIEEAWQFIEEQTGVPFDRDQLNKRIEQQNELQRFEWEKWDVAIRIILPSMAYPRHCTVFISPSSVTSPSGMRPMQR